MTSPVHWPLSPGVSVELCVETGTKRDGGLN